ncbi:MAG: glycerophosphodiester phosphodiesterase [Akkermansiaceae bacterium]
MAERKKRHLGALGVLLVLGIALSILIWNRFYFSPSLSPTLAAWQGNTTSDQLDHPRPLIIGHRGAGLESTAGSFPIGNTPNAIQRAVEAKVDWIEIDLQKSKDGHLVVFHDLELDLKTNGQGKLSDHTLNQLTRIKVHVNPTESIHSLDDTFGRFHSPTHKWIFDIKAPGIHQEVIAWLNKQVTAGALTKEQIIIFGKFEILQGFKETGFTLGYTATWGESGSKYRALFSPSTWIERTQDLGSRFLVLPVIYAHESMINRARNSGLEVWVYGTDEPSDFYRLASRGVTGFITDRPKRAAESLAIVPRKHAP